MAHPLSQICLEDGPAVLAARPQGFVLHRGTSRMRFREDVEKKKITKKKK